VRLWIDTDVGTNPDDAVALLCAAGHRDVDLVGVSTVDGDTEWRAEVARALRNVVCVGPRAAAAGFHEPSLVFMTGTSTLLTDGSGAADFLGQGSCRFALVESRTERAFVQRAEAIGLRYNVAKRVEGYNISQGKAVSIAIFRSEGTE